MPTCTACQEPHFDGWESFHSCSSGFTAEAARAACESYRARLGLLSVTECFNPCTGGLHLPAAGCYVALVDPDVYCNHGYVSYLWYYEDEGTTGPRAGDVMTAATEFCVLGARDRGWY